MCLWSQEMEDSIVCDLDLKVLAELLHEKFLKS